MRWRHQVVGRSSHVGKEWWLAGRGLEQILLSKASFVVIPTSRGTPGRAGPGRAPLIHQFQLHLFIIQLKLVGHVGYRSGPCLNPMISDTNNATRTYYCRGVLTHSSSIPSQLFPFFIFYYYHKYSKPF